MSEKIQLTPNEVDVWLSDQISHPEARDGEFFWGTCCEKVFPLIPWESKRKGKTPLDLNRLRIDNNSNLRPVFIRRSEVEKFVRKHTKLPLWCSGKRKKVNRSLGTRRARRKIKIVDPLTISGDLID